MSTQQLHDALMIFYGECLHAYPALLNNPELRAIEADMKQPVPEGQDATENPAYRLLLFLSEYQDSVDLPSYQAVYDAYEALLSEAGV